MKSKGKSKPQWSTSRRTICSILNSATAVGTVGSVVHSHTLHYLQLLSLSTSNDMILLKKWFTRFGHLETIMLADLNPVTAKVAIGFLGPFLSGYGFLFILRIVMSWYPKLPVEKFPYIVAYAPTEPLLKQTRKLIPPVGGVDVTPVVWFGLLSFLNEILVGPQGLLVLLSQQV